MIGDDDESPPRPQHADRSLEPFFEGFEFVVDRDSECLKDQGRRIVSSPASDAEFPNQIDEISRGLEGCGVAPGDDALGESAGAGQLAILGKDLLEFFGSPCGEQAGGGRAIALSIHAHIQWDFGYDAAAVAAAGGGTDRPEAKAALRRIELMGGDAEVARHAGLLHEIGQVADNGSGNAIFNAAELCAKYQEPEGVVTAIRSLHPDVQALSLEALLLDTANRLSETRPGARKENLAVFIERLRRLEEIAGRFDGVRNAYAVKAGKELRVLLNADGTRDEAAYDLCKQIARAVEKELSYPGQIKVSVVRETRAVRFAV